MARRKLTQEQTDQIVSLAAQGQTAAEIAQQLNIPVAQVSGKISYAVRVGEIPPSKDTRPTPQPSPVPIAEPRPAAVPSHGSTSEVPMQHQPSSLPVDDQNWQSPGGSPDGFIHPTQVVEYKIERIEPKDGFLEVTGAFPSEHDLGNRYGSGTYRVWKREGTKAPVFKDIIIAGTYGEPRVPSRRPLEARPARPSSFPPPRPAHDDPEDRFQRPFTRPYGPMMDVRPFQDRSQMELAQRGLSAQESIAVTAVNKLAEINEKQLDRMEKDRDRDREPANAVTELLKEQQASAERRAQEEIKRREEERKRDREEWERRESEREAAHRREMDRIKMENDARIAAERETRQTLMELESKKLDLIREEARAREAALKGELEKIRLEAKEERDEFRQTLKENEEKTEEQLEEMQAAVKEELQKERDALKREHELKEKHLENEQKLKEDLLRLREEIVKGQHGEDLSKVLAKLVEGVERTAKEVLDLKKIEAVSAEERLAKVGQGGAQQQPAPGANLTQIPPQAARHPEQQHPAMQGARPGNGAHAQEAPAQQPQPSGQPESTEAMVIRLGREPRFIDMVNKWARQIESGNDAGIFSNMFMELMRDDGTAEAIQIRKVLSFFVDEMSTRNWAAMYDFLQPAIPKNLHPIFESPHAEVFYDQFKMMVVESVRDYWKMYFAQKQAELEAARQQQQAQPAETPVVEVAPRPVAATPAAPSGDEEPKPEVTVTAETQDAQ